jgi:hypothetical protein
VRRIPILAAVAIAGLWSGLAPAASAGPGTSRPEFEPVPAAPTEDAWIDVAPPRDREWLERPSAPPVAAPCGGASACEAPCASSPCAPDPCRWRFSFTIPLWVPSVSGTFASGDTRVHTGGWLSSSHGITDALDRLVSDTSTSLEFFFMGRLEARRGPWTIEAEGYYASLTDTVDWKVRDEDASGTLDAAIVRVYGAWQESSPLGSCPTSPVLAVGPLVGARWYDVSLSVDPATGSNVHASRSWIDPIVGVKADVRFCNGASWSGGRCSTWTTTSAREAAGSG